MIPVTTHSHTKQALRVMVVGGGPAVLPRVEPMLPAGAYEVEFVGIDQEPYGCILDDAPDRCVDLDRAVRDAARVHLHAVTAEHAATAARMVAVVLA